MYYHGGQSVLRTLDVMTAASAASKTTILVNGKLPTGNKFYYDTGANLAAVESVTYGTPITTANWTGYLKDSSNNATTFQEITPTAGHKVARVVEVDSSNYPLAIADVLLNIG